MDIAGRRVLITGAASGIGRATAEAAARAGAEVHLTDLDAAGLDRAAAAIRAEQGRVGVVRAADVTDLEQVRALADEVHAQGGSVDVVMNIAGIATWGTVDRLEHADWRRTIDINLMGPVHVIETFLPPMIAAGRGGHLVNVSSAAGLIGLPWHAPYSASKFGLRGLSEVLRFDLREHRIGVSLVCPGGVDTPLTSTVRVAGVDTGGAAFQRLQRHFRRHAVTPEQAAAAILRGVRRNTYLVYTSRDIQALFLTQRVLPPVHDLILRGMNLAFRRAMRPVLAAPASAGAS
ncbi:MAG: SDR family oxidoreductase [Jatrophihabitans sp.]|uniref:SDR family oxidoreductase n=1 Tax=Jatrophihabitans sp. TaxID=1932789 RepID=UPI003F810CC0